MRCARVVLLSTLLVPCVAARARAQTQAAAAREASAVVVEQCVADHDAAQMYRIREQWRQARDAMTRCADERCPLAIRSDCRAWREELTRISPTLLIVIEREVENGRAVELEIDGQRQLLSDSTASVEVLPGRHHLKFTLAGHQPVEQEVFLDKDEKRRVLRVRFRRAAPAPPRVAPRETRIVAPERPIPPVTYWLSAGAVASFVVAGVFLGTAVTAIDDARETCAPECGDRARSIRLQLFVADVAGAVGVVLAGVGAYTFFTRPAAPRAGALRLNVSGARGQGAITLEGRF